MATTLLVVAALVLSTLATFSIARSAAAAYDDPDDPKTIFPIDGVPTDIDDTVVVKWNDELLQTIRANPAATGPTITARAIGVLHTAIYDAWAAYDPVPDGVHYTVKATGITSDTIAADREKAISFAAHKTLTWLFPGRAGLDVDPGPAVLGEYDAQLQELNYALDDSSPAAQIGRAAAQATIAFRGNDNSNQTTNPDGTVTYPGPCPATQPLCYDPENTNTWDKINKPLLWQPLCVLTPAGVAAGKPHLPVAPDTCGPPYYAVQNPLTPHWGNVKSFALTSPQLFTPPGPPPPGADGSYNPTEVETALRDTSNLDDTKKVIAEYWADGPRSEFPPGHWALLGHALSRKRLHSLDTDTKLFFVMGNALLDASISSWAAKYNVDCTRPTSAIRHRYADQKITSWLGPYKGYGLVDGKDWRPYQHPTVVTPPFPEYTSGHSTFSAAARIAIIAFTGSDTFNGQVTIKAGTSLFEPRIPGIHPGVPARDVTLKWKTFLAAADQAGMSRRYGGIHFESGDRHGRANGASVGWTVYDKAKRYWEGTEV
jgi:hypothetical protein